MCPTVERPVDHLRPQQKIVRVLGLDRTVWVSTYLSLPQSFACALRSQIERPGRQLPPASLRQLGNRDCLTAQLVCLPEFGYKPGLLHRHGHARPNL